MNFSNFFRASWLVQLLVGAGLFSVSFLIENQVLQAFISVPTLALFLAITLEIGKATAIVWHRYMTMQSIGSYPLVVCIVSGLFRAGLVVFSLICSMLFLAGHLDRPNLAEVRASELQDIQQQFDTELERLEAQRTTRIEALRNRHQTEYTDARQRYDRRIVELEAELRQEMDNVVDGVFKGPRYAEFERLLIKERADRNKALTALAERHAKDKNDLDQQLQQFVEKARQAAYAKREQQREDQLAKDYAEDERVNDRRIVAVLNMAEAVFQMDIKPLQFIFIFSALLSLLIELGILLAFDTVTVAMLPALKAQHESEVKTEILKSKIAGEAVREGIDHESEMDRVAKRADRTMEQAESMLGKFKHKAA